MKRKPTVSKLKRKLDAVFSQYIRLKSSEAGLAKCYTCGVTKDWQSLQNGHYIPRRHLNTRWLELNCKPQCMPCNIYKKGNYDVYALNLTKEYGPNILKDLNRAKNITKKFTILDLQRKIEEYDKKFLEL